ncbi:hypothetical protein [Rariglobus hedericola]|uniref:Uncharacterized protein n=1 Tax=Rariglobus hedericola TaxID=2597822 RepID=A0A556QLL5_9BACT|nr:hypothetical protein [Rariglobus hedericola]TSJ77523.1 hypothetical protein FPL22_15675 [Rariglobus hedericola]
MFWTSVVFAATPPEFEFTKTLLPNSKHVSTEMVSGRLNGSAISIYRGKESIESVVAALEKHFGKKLIFEESDSSWRETGRLFGQAGHGETTAHGQYLLDQLRVNIFIFQLIMEDYKTNSVVLIIEPK